MNVIFRGLREPLVALNIPEHKSALSLSALTRMQLFLQQDLQIKVIHIPGAINAADPFTRFADNQQPREIWTEVVGLETSQNFVNTVSTQRVNRDMEDLNPPAVKIFPVQNLRPLGMPFLEVVREKSDKTKKPAEGAIWKHEVWIRSNTSTGRDCVCIPLEGQALALMIAHNQFLGHAGIYGTKAFCSKYFYWDEMDKDIETYVKNCLSCQMVKASPLHAPSGRLYFGVEPFEQLAIDFAETPEALTGERYMLVMVDPFTGHICLKPSLSETGEEAAQKLLDYGTIYVFPRQIWSDKARHFCLKMLDELMKMTNSLQFFGTANAPWTKGIVEHMVRLGERKNFDDLAGVESAGRSLASNFG